MGRYKEKEMTLIDSQAFQKIKAIRGRNNPEEMETDNINATEDADNDNGESSENIEFYVLSKVTLDEEVVVHDRVTVMKQSWKTTYEVINEKYFEQTDVMFPKDFIKM